MVCDRCRKVEEIVVAVVQALPLRKTWAICGACKQELPEGFQLAWGLVGASRPARSREKLLR
jgi:hypothetical protein